MYGDAYAVSGLERTSAGVAGVRDEAGVVALRHADPEAGLPEVVEESDLLLDVLVVVDEEAAALNESRASEVRKRPPTKGLQYRATTWPTDA